MHLLYTLLWSVLEEDKEEYSLQCEELKWENMGSSSQSRTGPPQVPWKPMWEELRNEVRGSMVLPVEFLHGHPWLGPILDIEVEVFACHLFVSQRQHEHTIRWTLLLWKAALQAPALAPLLLMAARERQQKCSIPASVLFLTMFTTLRSRSYVHTPLNDQHFKSSNAPQLWDNVSQSHSPTAFPVSHRCRM